MAELWRGWVEAVQRSREDFDQFYDGYAGDYRGCFDKEALREEWVCATVVERDGAWVYDPDEVSSGELERMFQANEREDA